MPHTNPDVRPAPWILRGILYRRPTSPSEWALAVAGATVLYSLVVVPVGAIGWLINATV